MANYYHEAREAKKALKTVSLENKHRREIRKADGLEEDHIEHPLNYLTIDGRPMRLYPDLAQHTATESQQALIPWNDDPGNLIDRFDCRALLDFYREPAAKAAPRARTSQEQKLDELLRFEGYRDLVRLKARGLSEEAGLKLARDQILEIRAGRRVQATTSFRVQSHQPVNVDAVAATQGVSYNAMGFSYDTPALGPGYSSSSSSEDSEEEEEAVGGQSTEEVAAEAEQTRLDELAEGYGLKHFMYRLQKAQEAEGEAEAAMCHRVRKRKGRKAARERTKRMAGQGLRPSGKPLNKDWHDPVAMNAPSAYLYKPRRPTPERKSSSRSRSPSPSRAYLALPSINASHIDRKAFEREEDSILDALPDMPDPALPGAQMFPKASAMLALSKQQDAERKQQRDRSRERSRERGYRRSRSRSRSRDRDRGYRRGRSRSRDRGRGGRSNSRDAGTRKYGMGSASGSVGVGSSATTPKPPAGTANKAETPQDRMKRIMATQLAKQQSKDSVVVAHKKIQAEKDRLAREHLERAMRHPSPRRRSRSRSPRRRSRSTDRDRY